MNYSLNLQLLVAHRGQKDGQDVKVDLEHRESTILDVALTRAAGMGRSGIVLILLAGGADVNAQVWPFLLLPKKFLLAKSEENLFKNSTMVMFSA